MLVCIATTSTLNTKAYWSYKWHNEWSVIPSPDQNCLVYKTGGPISLRVGGPGEGGGEKGGQGLPVDDLSLEFPAGVELGSIFALFVAGSLRNLIDPL